MFCAQADFARRKVCKCRLIGIGAAVSPLLLCHTAACTIPYTAIRAVAPSLPSQPLAKLQPERGFRYCAAEGKKIQIIDKLTKNQE